MDAFQQVQAFFEQMHCHFCHHTFKTDDVELIREDNGFYLVNVFCHRCRTQNGVALVGVETHDGHSHPLLYPDPELTEEELERLSVFEPICEDDILAAHEFFQGLDANWASKIPDDLKPVHLDTLED